MLILFRKLKTYRVINGLIFVINIRKSRHHTKVIISTIYSFTYTVTIEHEALIKTKIRKTSLEQQKKETECNIRAVFNIVIMDI